MCQLLIQRENLRFLRLIIGTEVRAVWIVLLMIVGKRK